LLICLSFIVVSCAPNIEQLNASAHQGEAYQKLDNIEVALSVAGTPRNDINTFKPKEALHDATVSLNKKPPKRSFSFNPYKFPFHF
jgi:hypothetical protein